MINIKDITTKNMEILKVLEECKQSGIAAIEQTAEIKLTDAWEGCHVATVEFDFAKDIDKQILALNKKYEDTYPEEELISFLNDLLDRRKYEQWKEKNEATDNEKYIKAVEEAKKTGKPVCFIHNLPFENSKVYAYPDGRTKKVMSYDY